VLWTDLSSVLRTFVASCMPAADVSARFLKPVHFPAGDGGAADCQKVCLGCSAGAPDLGYSIGAPYWVRGESASCQMYLV